MSSKRCCIPQCVEVEGQHKILHLFPNPDKEIERFRTWIYAIGGNILSLSNEYIYKHRKVCHAHFEEKYCCRNNRISNIAVPTLHIPGPLSRLIFTFEETRPLRKIQNLPSTSKNPVAIEIVSDVSSKGLEHTLELNTTETTTVNNPVTEVVAPGVSSKVPEHILEINTNEKTVSRRTHKKTRIVASKKMFTTLECKLYQKLMKVRSQLSKCRRKVNKQSASLKAAKKLTSSPAFVAAINKMPNTAKLLTMLQFREIKKKDKEKL